MNLWAANPEKRCRRLVGIYLADSHIERAGDYKRASEPTIAKISRNDLRYDDDKSGVFGLNRGNDKIKQTQTASEDAARAPTAAHKAAEMHCLSAHFCRSVAGERAMGDVDRKWRLNRIEFNRFEVSSRTQTWSDALMQSADPLIYLYRR